MKFYKVIMRDFVIAVCILLAFGYNQYIAVHVYTPQVPDKVYASEKENTSMNTVPETVTAFNPVHMDMASFKAMNPDAVIVKLQTSGTENGDFYSNIYKIEQAREDGKQTMFVADVYIKKIECLKTALANNTYGKNIREKPMDMVKENNGAFGISGDNYGEIDSGVVIRNGKWYRSDAKRRDVCVLYKDGTMEIYQPGKFDETTVKGKDPWQAWTFGPGLLDQNGHALTKFNIDSYVDEIHPRCAIGYVEPGHYMLLVVDGRQDGYSVGVGLKDLGKIFEQLGCKAAYNLDGGKTATMMTADTLINRPCEGVDQAGGRDMSDIIYLEEANLS